MAATGLDLLVSPELLARAKAEWEEKMDGQPYVCPIPPDVHPAID
jgi:aminobenzoyl-glutamate utilization protein B